MSLLFGACYALALLGGLLLAAVPVLLPLALVAQVIGSLLGKK